MNKNPVQKYRRSRGGKHVKDRVRADVHSRVRNVVAHVLMPRTVTAAAIERVGMYNDHAEIAETVKEHVVPRQSLSRKLLLRVFPLSLETEVVHARQYDHKLKRMVETTHQRLAWKSDRTLLNPMKVETTMPTVKREGYVKVGP